jgi:ParB family chromosome partitioning protein
VARRSGLGKGLGALIPTEVDDSGSVYREISIADIIPNRLQPREHFDEETLSALAASVEEVGVIQPVVVREVEDGYELVAGERRWRAAARVGLETIPALVRTADDQSSLVTAVVENLHRQDLNPLEEAAAYQQLLDDFAMTQQQVAARVGRSRSAVANTIRLMQLPASVQGLLVEGRISAGHARALLAAPDAATQEALAAEIVENNLTVRQVEDRLREDFGTHDDTDEDTVADATSAGKKRVAKASGHADPAILELEELLAARLETRVAVKLGKGPGKLTIDFADLDDLERIYRIITPPGTVF